MNSDSHLYLYNKTVENYAIRYIQDQEFVQPGNRIVLEFEDGVQAFKAGYEQAVKDVIDQVSRDHSDDYVGFLKRLFQVKE